jgi:hypothetical protein
MYSDALSSSFFPCITPLAFLRGLFSLYFSFYDVEIKIE